MPRGRTIPSEVFRSVMDTARKQLLVDSEKAAAFEHKGIRGDERAASLMKFFRERLPDTLGIGKGEAIDCEDTRTGQVDFFIYDQARCAPISTGTENLLLPCEAIYCVIEVKTTITLDELKISYKAAGKVRALKPFQKPFVPARLGTNADDGSDRCLYIVFGFSSNLGNDPGWTQKEYTRLKEAAISEDVAIDCVDRLLVLDRGIIHPQKGAGKWAAASAESIFLEGYLNVVNFLYRESRRRAPVDWQEYGPRSSSGWKLLK